MYRVRGDDRYAHLTRFQVIPAVLLSFFSYINAKNKALQGSRNILPQRGRTEMPSCSLLNTCYINT